MKKKPKESEDRNEHDDPRPGDFFEKKSLDGGERDESFSTIVVTERRGREVSFFASGCGYFGEAGLKCMSVKEFSSFLHHHEYSCVWYDGDEVSFFDV